MRKLKGKAFGVLIMTYICMFFICQQDALADRKIYVGDIININISGGRYTEEQLREKFKEFDIMNIKKEDDGYILGVRTFDIGKKSVNLDGKVIEIEVYSIIENANSTEIHEGDSDRDVEFGSIYGYSFYVILLIFLITIFITIIKFFKKQGKANLSGIDRFQNAMREVKFEEIEAPTTMTILFKRYLEEKYSWSIMGKTSREIMKEIKNIPGLLKYLDEIGNWLEKCDKMKYSREISTPEEVVELFSELYKLVQSIEYHKGGAVL